MENKFFKIIIKLITFVVIGFLLYNGIKYFFYNFSDINEIWIDKFSYIVMILFYIFSFFSILRLIIILYGKGFLEDLSKLFNNFKIDFLKNKTVSKFIKNNPKTFRFIKKRFKKDEFTGIPLTILSLMIFYIIFVFFGFVEDILTSDIIKGLDYRLAAFLYAFRNEFLVNIFLWITYLGRSFTIIGFFIITSTYFFYRNYKNEALALTISLLGSTFFANALKLLFHHERPEYAIYKETSFSFPSGHAVLSVSFYGFIFWVLIRGNKNWKLKINYLFSFLLIAFLIGFSRLYLGVHYLSDVLGGYLIGTLWLLFAIGITEYFNHKYKKNSVQEKTLKCYFIKYLLIVFGIIFFAFLNFRFPYILDRNFVELAQEREIQNAQEIFPASYLKYTQTFLGEKAENVNFVFFAKNDTAIEEVFKNSGRHNSDKLGYTSIRNIGNNLLYQKPYNTAPITPLFWDNKTQDFSFQKLPDNKDIRFRHHIRIWKTNLKFENYYIYVGVGIFDDGLKRDITHKIDPDIDKEREYIFNDLKSTKLIDKYSKTQLVNAYKGKNIFGDYFFTDGKCYFIKIK